MGYSVFWLFAGPFVPVLLFGLYAKIEERRKEQRVGILEALNATEEGRAKVKLMGLLGWDPDQDAQISRWEQIIHAVKLLSNKEDPAKQLSSLLHGEGDGLTVYTNKGKWIHKGSKYAGKELGAHPTQCAATSAAQSADLAHNLEADCLALLQAMNKVHDPSCVADFKYFVRNNHLLIGMARAEAANPLSRESRIYVGAVYLLWHWLGNFWVHLIMADDGSTYKDSQFMTFLIKFAFINLPAGLVAKNGLGFLLGCPCIVGSTGCFPNFIRKSGQLIARVFAVLTYIIVCFWFFIMIGYIFHDRSPDQVEGLGPTDAAEVEALFQRVNKSSPMYDPTLVAKIVRERLGNDDSDPNNDDVLEYWCNNGGGDSIDVWQCHVLESMLWMSFTSILISEIKWFGKQLSVGFNPLCHGKCSFGGWNAERENLVHVLEQITGTASATTMTMQLGPMEHANESDFQVDDVDDAR
jgi:hypothetical protein